MQTLLRQLARAGRRFRNQWVFGTLAVLTLSLGVGATAAAFTLVDGIVPHAASYPSCDLAARHSNDPLAVIVDAPDGALDFQDRVAVAYDTGYEAAAATVGSWENAAVAVVRHPLLAVLSAAALALLVACSNEARALSWKSAQLFRDGGAAWAILVAAGALSVAALLLRLLAAPAMAALLGAVPASRLDGRAIAFTLCVSALAEARRRRSLARLITICPSSARP